MPAVVVMCLNKRRKTIKFPTNYTVFQILELVCKKEQLNPNEYTLRSNSGILDKSLQWTFTNLANNAKLELCALESKSNEGKPVEIALQLETGQRFQSNFQPSCTLLDVFKHFESEINRNNNYENMVPVIVYMRQEIVGEDLFLKTTLVGLGIVTGRALLRLMFTMKKQAGNNDLTQSHTLPIPPVTARKSDERPHTNLEACDKSAISVLNETEEKVGVIKSHTFPIPPVTSPATAQNSDKRPSHTNSEASDKSTMSVSNEIEDKVLKNQDVAYLETPNASLLSRLTEPCDRHPMLFHASSIQSSSADEELSDDFFDITVTDLRKMIADLRQQQSTEEDLLVGAQRRQKKMTTLTRHPKTLIRVVFSTQHVLQGWFRPLETVSDLYNFVSQHVAISGFYLFIAPPKKILNQMDKTLFDCDLSPASKVFCGIKDKTLFADDFLEYTSLSLSGFDDANNAISGVYSQLKKSPVDQVS